MSMIDDHQEKLSHPHHHTKAVVDQLARTAGHITSFTPLYGAPEQFNRAFGATGPWTDVFALGVTLYELSTQRRAFRAGAGRHDQAAFPEWSRLEWLGHDRDVRCFVREFRQGL